MQRKGYCEAKCQQAQSIKSLGWKSIIPTIPKASELKGWWSIEQIVDATGWSKRHVQDMLRKQRVEGMVETRPARAENGRIITVYKE